MSASPAAPPAPGIPAAGGPTAWGERRLPRWARLAAGWILGVAVFVAAWSLFSPARAAAAFRAAVVWPTGLESLFSILLWGAVATLFAVLGVLVGVAAARGAGLAAGRLLATAVSGTLFAVLASAVLTTVPWQEAGVGGAEDFDTLALTLFVDHALALIVLGVILTAALIGAMVIARPLGSRPDIEVHYPTRLPRSGLRAVQDVSDVDKGLQGKAAQGPSPGAPGSGRTAGAGVGTAAGSGAVRAAESTGVAAEDATLDPDVAAGSAGSRDRSPRDEGGEEE